ncbi:MAG: aminoacyl-tRNA hydrolase [Candidatus Saccharimonadales bacterium]
MGLFQKQPYQLKQNLPYTISMATTAVLIVGLGNPGDEYNGTRHNIGFMALDWFAKKNEFSDWREDNKYKGYIAEKTLGSVRVILLKPSTFMNLSGESVQAVANFYKIPPERIVVVHDELSIAFGQIRNRIGGQAAGHNGIKSVIQHIGDNFGRVRVGIKDEFSKITDTSKFVLAKFTKVEQSYLDDIYTEVNGILTEYIYGSELPNDTRSIVFDYGDE